MISSLFPWWFPIGTTRRFWLLSCCAETGPSKAATKGAWLKAGRLAVVWVQSSIQTRSDCPILLKFKVAADITAVCWLNAWWFCLLVLVLLVLALTIWSDMKCGKAGLLRRPCSESYNNMSEDFEEEKRKRLRKWLPPKMIKHGYL